MKKIVFIGGMCGSKRDIFLIKRILKEFNILYFKYDSSLTKTIEQYSLELKKFINKINLNKNEKIKIVSFSAGGIIAEYYLKFVDNDKVDKIIAVCSPFKGSWLPLIYPRKMRGLQECKKNSIFLKKLRAHKLKETIGEKTFWCLFDPIVPGISARGENPEHTFFPLHWIIQFWPPLIYKIRKFLLN